MTARPLTSEDLRWLVCPACHQSVQLNGDGIVCLGCARRYPIVDGIPVLLPDRAL